MKVVLVNTHLGILFISNNIVNAKTSSFEIAVNRVRKLALFYM